MALTSRLLGPGRLSVYIVFVFWRERRFSNYFFIQKFLNDDTDILIIISCRTVDKSINFPALIYRLHLLENFRPTVANKSELEVCLYFFPIHVDKHV